MTFMEIAKRAEKLVADNSPSILTALGVTGTVTTALLTGTATFKAAEILEDEQCRLNIQTPGHKKPHILEPKEKFKLVWKLYIPAVSVGVVTIVCVITANRIGTRRAAAVAAAFSISEKAASEYKEKVLERFGEVKEQKIRDELSQERVDRDPVGEREVIITGNGEVLCYDEFSGRYFKSSMETLKKAQNDINYRIINDSYASLSDFYDRIGLSATTFSEEVGWTLSQQLELKFSTSISDDQRPCISLGFRVAPVRDYYKLG